MKNKQNPCAEGLTPECFEKYPRYAKKVFAYKLLQAILPAPLTMDLLGMLWRHLVEIPISWMEWEDFIIPEDIPLEEIIPDDWDPDDPLPDELTINLNEIIPDDWEEGDPLPDGVTIDPGTEIPDDWKVGNEIPEGIHIDIKQLFPDDWTIGNPLPEGIVLDVIAILPKVWTVGEDLPFGIKVDPNFRIDTDMLKTLGIYVEPGKTYEEVFPNGWDPTSELPDGSSWYPYIEPEKKEAGAVPPLYLSPWEFLARYKSQSYVIALKTWFLEPFNDFTTNEWTKYESGSGLAEITLEKRLKLKSPSFPNYSYVYRFGAYPYPENYNINIITHCIAGPGKTTFAFYTGSYRLIFIMEPNNRIGCYWAGGLLGADVVDFMNRDVTWIIQVRAGHFNILQDGDEVVSLHQVQSADYMEGEMWIESGLAMETDIDEILILEYL